MTKHPQTELGYWVDGVMVKPPPAYDVARRCLRAQQEQRRPVFQNQQRHNMPFPVMFPRKLTKVERRKLSVRRKSRLNNNNNNANRTNHISVTRLLRLSPTIMDDLKNASKVGDLSATLEVVWYKLMVSKQRCSASSTSSDSLRSWSYYCLVRYLFAPDMERRTAVYYASLTGHPLLVKLFLSMLVMLQCGTLLSHNSRKVHQLLNFCGTFEQWLNLVGYLDGFSRIDLEVCGLNALTEALRHLVRDTQYTLTDIFYCCINGIKTIHHATTAATATTSTTNTATIEEGTTLPQPDQLKQSHPSTREIVEGPVGKGKSLCNVHDLVCWYATRIKSHARDFRGQNTKPKRPKLNLEDDDDNYMDDYHDEDDILYNVEPQVEDATLATVAEGEEEDLTWTMTTIVGDEPGQEHQLEKEEEEEEEEEQDAMIIEHNKEQDGELLEYEIEFVHDRSEWSSYNSSRHNANDNDDDNNNNNNNDDDDSWEIQSGMASTTATMDYSIDDVISFPSLSASVAGSQVSSKKSRTTTTNNNNNKQHWFFDTDHESQSTTTNAVSGRQLSNEWDVLSDLASVVTCSTTMAATAAAAGDDVPATTTITTSMPETATVASTVEPTSPLFEPQQEREIGSATTTMTTTSVGTTPSSYLAALRRAIPSTPPQGAITTTSTDQAVPPTTKDVPTTRCPNRNKTNDDDDYNDDMDFDAQFMMEGAKGTRGGRRNWNS